MVDWESERKTGRRVPFPRWGMLGAAVAVALMVVVSAHVWSALPDPVVTDTGVDGRVAGTVPRWFFVSIMPLATLTLGGKFALVSVVGSAVQRASGLRVPWPEPVLGRALNLFLLLMALLLAVIHTVMLHHEAGRELPPSTDHLMVLTMASFLSGTGLIVLLLRQEGEPDTLLSRWWSRARGPVAGGILLVGVVTAAAGLLLPDPVVAAYLVGLVNPAVLVGCAFPFLWSRKWRRKSEDDS